MFSRTPLLFLSTFVATLTQAALPEFTNLPYSNVALNTPLTLAYTAATPTTPVTIILLGGATNTTLQVISTLTSTSTGGTYTWTPDPCTLTPGTLYGLEILQAGQPENWSNAFNVTANGPVCAGTSVSTSSSSVMPATTSSSSMATTSAESTSVTTSATTVVAVVPASISSSISSGFTTSMTMSGNGTSFVASTQKPTVAAASTTGAPTTSSKTSAVTGASASVTPYDNRNAASGNDVARMFVLMAFVGAVACLL